MNNSAMNGGGGLNAWDSALNFKGSSTFMNNSALSGGGIVTDSSTLNFGTSQHTGMCSEVCNSDNLVFMNNLALTHGGAVYTKYSTIIL